MEALNFNKISFGKTDASNELSEVGDEFYLSSFWEYDKYRIKDFLEGKRYYIVGRKGTGKTALLKYLECTFKKQPENLVIPIRFKSDFDEIDKKGVKAASINLDDEIIDNGLTPNLKSYVSAWQVYLIYQIYKHSETTDGEYSVFKNEKDFMIMCKLLELVYGKDGGSKIVPKITKGSISVAAGTRGIDASLSAEIEFHDNRVNFELVVKKIIELYKKLHFDRNPVYVLVDELELSIKTKKLREADIELIRDLVLAINNLNRLSQERNFEIHFYASARTDVLESLLSSGYEINKCIEDYGVKVEWYQRGGNYCDNPLLKLLEKKINASEKANGLAITENVWEKYFEPQINRLEVRKFLLTFSWYRPRDMVRMMQYAQMHCKEDAVKVNQEAFDRAIQEYSNRMWSEVTEELALKFNAEELKAIKKILTGIEVPFTKTYIEKRIEVLAKDYDYIKQFKEKYRVTDLLDLLFDWGIIGNSGERMVFSFLGYTEMDIMKPMIIHTPLRNFFEVVSYSGH